METKCLNYPEAKDSSNFSKATIKGGIRSNRIKIAKMICNQTGICLPPQNLFCFDGNIGIANRHFTPKLPKVNRTESYHWTNIASLLNGA
jgi:hypothetical protein